MSHSGPRLFRDLQANPAAGIPSAATIGNFDGLHLGHQALLRKVVQLAGSRMHTALVSFEPLPLAFFYPERAPARLQTPRQRYRQLARSGIDLFWLLRFNAELASMSPRTFVSRVLVEGLNVRHVVVGEDFRFGRDRSGDVELLSRYGAEFGYQVHCHAAERVGGVRVSSSAIRTALADGEMALAQAYLGRPFELGGRVIAGNRLGRKLGYPTANIRVGLKPCPVGGIYAVRCAVEGIGNDLPGVASIGHRPTVGGSGLLLEVHLFDFDADLYRRRMRVRLISRIRDEEHFEDLEQLVAQMREDEEQARRLLANAE